MFKGAAKMAYNYVGFDVRRLEPKALTPLEIQRILIPDCRTIFDVGARLGITIDQYRALFPEALIHAFEPTPEAVATLRGKASNDALLKVHPIALSDACGSADLSLNKFGPTNSLLRSEPDAPIAVRDLMATSNTISVETSTIDTFCRLEHIDAIDILKIDVQGSEGRVLAGAADMLRSGRIKSILLEVIVAKTYEGQASAAEIFSVLGDAGFEIVDFYDLYRDRHQLLQFDVVFVHSGIGSAHLSNP